MGTVAGTFGRTLAFWAIMLVALAVGHAGGWSQQTVGIIGLLALILGPFAAYYRTRRLALQRESHESERLAAAIAEGVRRSRDV